MCGFCKLNGKKVFSKLDLQSAYWNFLMDDQSIEKTVFCPGPGYGLWEFTVSGSKDSVEDGFSHNLPLYWKCLT